MKMHSSVYATLKKTNGLEFHVFAKFRCNNIGVRIAVVLTEKAAQRIGNWANEEADDVWYKAVPRKPTTKPYRKKKR
jgi:hypothetical protein